MATPTVVILLNTGQLVGINETTLAQTYGSTLADTTGTFLTRNGILYLHSVGGIYLLGTVSSASSPYGSASALPRQFEDLNLTSAQSIFYDTVGHHAVAANKIEDGTAPYLLYTLDPTHDTVNGLVQSQIGRAS